MVLTPYHDTQGSGLSSTLEGEDVLDGEKLEYTRDLELDATLVTRAKDKSGKTSHVVKF